MRGDESPEAFAHKVPKQMKFCSFVQVQKQTVFGFMSFVWHRQVEHNADAEGICGIAVNILLINLLIFKYS